MLFAWVLCTHAFDVPARRDVAYSLAGSAALMAVAAAQSVDLTLGALRGGVGGLRAVGTGGHVAVDGRGPGRPLGDPGRDRGGGGRRGRPAGLGPARPEGVHLLIFPSSSANSSPVDSPSNLTDGSASLPAHAASPSGRTGVGGFLGFAKSLDTGTRASLGRPGGPAGPGQPAQLLGGRDLRQLERAELDAGPEPGQRRAG